MNRYLAEFFGTWILMFAGIGTALYDGKNIGHLGISLAFGLTLTALIYAIGPISGCHLNPAVTIGLAVAKKFKWSDAGGYIIAQVLGGMCAFGTIVSVLYFSGSYNQSMALSVANGFGDNSPTGVGLAGAFIVEAFMTFVLVFTIFGATSEGAPAGFAAIAIGAALTVANFVAIPITNGSINPVRSIGPAVYGQGWALSDLWLFIAAPIVGGIVAALLYTLLSS